MKQATIAALLLTASAAQGSQCMTVADAAVEAADAAQRGQPVGELIARIHVQSESAQLTLRKFIITAYEMGKTNSLQDVFDRVYSLCNATTDEKPA